MTVLVTSLKDEKWNVDIKKLDINLDIAETVQTKRITYFRHAVHINEKSYQK